MVHTIAPRAALTILLVKGTSLDSADQAVAASIAALRMGATEGGIISLSPAGQIGGEHCVTHTQLEELNNALRTDAHHHVTVVAATGDSGAAGEPCALIDALSAGISQQLHPDEEKSPSFASDPLVLGAGGTTLSASHTDRRLDRRDRLGPPRRHPRHGLPGVRRGLQPPVPPARPIRTRSTGSARCAASLTSQPTPTRTPAAASRSSQATPARATRSANTAARAPAHRSGLGSSRSPTSTRNATSASSTRPSTEIARSPHYHQAFHDITNGSRNTAKFPPRHDHRLPSRPRLGPRHRLGQPEREGARTPTRFPRNPLAAASRVPASDQRGWVVRSTVPSC